MKIMASMRVLAVSAVVMFALGACSGAGPERPASAPAPRPSPPEIVGATSYAVNAADSAVHILVRRGGLLARFGHDHVVTSRSVTGRLWLRPGVRGSGFELGFPVGELIVDDPETRRLAGAEFGTSLSAADREGTRRNMLGAAVLDAGRHPRVELRSSAVSGSLPKVTAQTWITLRGVSREVQVPAAVSLDGPRLTATGEFEIEQSAFGIEPFTAALGALSVQDRVTIRFEIAADEVLAPGR